MDHSLINPNQCRFFGIRVYDDPTDDNRKLGMELSENYSVPFTMRGTTCNFESRSPDTSELENCRTFQVSDANVWNPTYIFRRTWTSVCFYVCVWLVRLVFAWFVLVWFWHNTGQPNTHYFSDSNLGTASGGWRRITISQVGNRLDKPRNTLKSTTLLNVRSALLPLIRRYRTDLLSQRLRRFNTRFYTDTMFSKVGTSLRGNTCANIHWWQWSGVRLPNA